MGLLGRRESPGAASVIIAAARYAKFMRSLLGSQCGATREHKTRMRLVFSLRSASLPTADRVLNRRCLSAPIRPFSKADTCGCREPDALPWSLGVRIILH